MDHRLQLYNTLSRKVEPFKAQYNNDVSLYVCGPTVYGPPHLGHARSAITFDLLRRYLTFLGYQVRHVCNITDVGHMTQEEAQSGEDKIIAQAQKEKKLPMEVAHHYTQIYEKEMEMLGVLPPTLAPRATGHIIAQITLTEKLLAQGDAYLVNGSVYFDVPKYNQKRNYGALSGRKIEELRTGHRTLVATQEKRHPADFALWKKAPDTHIMGWPSPWGRGYPGWHTECAAMSLKYLGTNFDIHGGGLDLTLHHDCEIAQVQAYSQKPLARFWVHHNWVTIHGEKMSKSAGNFITLKACFSGDHPFLQRAYPPMVIRFFLLYAHYRSPLDLSQEGLHQATKGYEKIINGYKMAQTEQAKTYHPTQVDEAQSQEVLALCQGCHDAMNHDLNTTQLITHLLALVKHLQNLQQGEKSLSQKAWQQLHTTYLHFVRDILGLTPPSKSLALVDALLQIYQQAKQKKDYPQVDAIRQALKKENISLQDQGTHVDWRYTFT